MTTQSQLAPRVKAKASSPTSAPPPGQAKSWREAKIDSRYVGTVVVKKQDEEEYLFITSPEVRREYGRDAQILDDGRSPGVILGEQVAFGVLRQDKALLAVNVWRMGRKRPLQEKKPAMKRPSWKLSGEVRQTRGVWSIFAQDILDAYGEDVPIPPSEVPEVLAIGDQVSFEVQEQANGKPLVRNVRVVQAAKYVTTPKAVSIAKPKAKEEPRAKRVPEKVEAKAPPKEQELPLPTSPAEWAAAQKRLFGDLPPLPPGWIRIRSRTSGEVYFYNQVTGVSSPDLPSS